MKNIFTKMMTTGLILSSSIYANDSTTLTDAFKDGKFNGTLGTYFEGTSHEDEYSKGGVFKSKDSFAWQTAYLSLKYETARWHKLKLGAKLFAHGKLFDDSDGDSAFKKDIEQEFAIPELYLDYAFTDDTTFRVGRWAHKGFTHFDDAQSEGFYLQSKVNEKLSMVVGLMTSFAEIDYDDGEDFGRDNGTQDLDNEGKFGEDTDGYVMFGELTWKPADFVELNPYVYFHSGYASVTGLDVTLDTDVNETVNVGTNLMCYNVSADKDGLDDSFNWTIEPFVKVGSFTFSIGHSEFGGDGDEDNSLNKPAWFKEYMHGFDQDSEYGKQNASFDFAKIKYKEGKFATHLFFGVNDYGIDESKQFNLTELQVKYKFTSNWDANLRLFDVDYNGAAESSDYQKLEARVRYRF